MLLSLVIDRERPSGRRLTAMLVAFAGMGLVFGLPGGSPNLLGVALAVGAAVCYASAGTDLDGSGVAARQRTARIFAGGADQRRDGGGEQGAPSLSRANVGAY